MPWMFGLNLWSRAMEYWLFHRACEIFGVLASDDRGPDGLRKQRHLRYRVYNSRRIPVIFAWSSPSASLGVSKDPLHRTGLSSSTPASISPVFRLRGLGFGPSLPEDESCSAFVVFHHLDGFLRREPCGSVAPRSRSWGSPRCGLDA
jgi:hypothetical protein